VSFSIVPGSTGAGATFLGGGQATAVTDANGVATSPPLQANGSAGRFSAVASTDGVTAVADYSLDNHAAALTLGAVGSSSQSATIDSRYARPLTARLLDQDGQPIEGAGVTFTLGAEAANGGGAAAGASFVGGAGQVTVLTDPNGDATTPAILANGTPGEFTATATVMGSTASLTYALRNLAPRLVARTPSRSATVEHRYSRALSVRVRGADGKPLSGVSVTFTIGKASNNASASFSDGTSQATATTNKAGIATAPSMTANSIAGSFKASATLSGSRAAGYTLRNRAGQPATISTGAADGISAAIGSPLPIRLAVTVTDKDGNPVAGSLVRFTAPASDAGAGGHFTIRAHSTRTARVRTNAEGIAIAPSFTTNNTAGGYTVGVRAGARRAAFALVNR
jgi:protocatechuate 3,4-dioxygenase beta subunit